MNKEEKKAVKKLKEAQDRMIKPRMLKDVKYTNEDYSKAIDIVLNLVKEYEKEIEEWRNGIRINDKVSIPKDIIRAKIQIYKDKKADSIGMLINYEIWKSKIEILQELLGDDKNE